MADLVWTQRLAAGLTEPIVSLIRGRFTDVTYYYCTYSQVAWSTETDVARSWE